LAFSKHQGNDVSVYTIYLDGSGLTRLATNTPFTEEFITDWQPLPEATGPNTKADCKKDGYKDFGLKNQGECIKAVNHAS
jgi:hypothetical protein